MGSKRKFYVYAIVVDGDFRYIGMGSGNRAFHFRRYGLAGEKIEDAIADGSDVYSLILKDELTRLEACHFEDVALENCKGLWNERLANGKFVSGLWKDPTSIYNSVDYRTKHKRSMRRAMKDPKKGKNIRRGLEAGRTSEVHKKLWKDPTYRQARHEGHKDSFTEEWREKQSIAQTVNWQDPTYREKQMNARTHYRKPSHRKKMRAAISSSWSDPKQRANRLKTFRSPESLARRAQAAREAWVRRKG